MRRLIFAALLPIAAAAAAQQPAVPLPPNATAEGLPPIPQSIADRLAPYAEFRRASLLGWHPADRTILVTTRFGNAYQIHRVDRPGGARTQLTFYRDGIGGSAAYNPVNARAFVFTKDISGSGDALQIFRYDEATGRATMLTDGRSTNGVPVWAADGSRIAFDSTRRNGRDRDLWVMDPGDPASARLVAETEGAWSVADWSSDGRELLAVESVSISSESYVWRVNVETGAKTPLTPHADGKALWTSPVFGAGGRSVYALSNRGSEFTRVWRADVRTGTWTPVTPDRESVEAFAVSPDGRVLAIVFDRDAASVLELIDASTRRTVVTPHIPVGQISNLQWRPHGREVAFDFASVSTYGDVYSVQYPSGTLVRWTHSEIGGVKGDTLAAPEIIHWKSFDGRMISGILYRPPARFTGPRPVMINIHGGPNDPASRERPRFIGRSNYFLNELGIAIIYPNVRGTFGFGTTFEQLDDGRKREDAVKDVGALLDWIGAQPSLDERRVMVTGASYGGYMTLAVAEKYHDRIRCAFEGFGISNFLTYLENTEPSRQADRRAEYGDPSDPAMRAFLLEISPVTQASRLTMPLLIAQGRNDTRVPIQQAEEIRRAVAPNGNPVWYVVYDDGHGFTKRVNDDFNQYCWILFVQTYLLNGN